MSTDTVHFSHFNTWQNLSRNTTEKLKSVKLLEFWMELLPNFLHTLWYSWFIFSLMMKDSLTKIVKMKNCMLGFSGSFNFCSCIVWMQLSIIVLVLNVFLSSPLLFVLQALINADNVNGDINMVKDAVTYLLCIFRAIKRAEDVIDSEKTLVSVSHEGYFLIFIYLLSSDHMKLLLKKKKNIAEASPSIRHWILICYFSTSWWHLITCSWTSFPTISII